MSACGYWIHLSSYVAATPVRRCSQSLSVLLWPSAPHRVTDPSQDHYRTLQASILGPPDDWRRRIGRPRQSWLRTVEADLRPMILGLATSKRRDQDRSAWWKLVTTATSTTSSRRSEEVVSPSDATRRHFKAESNENKRHLGLLVPLFTQR